MNKDPATTALTSGGAKDIQLLLGIVIGRRGRRRSISPTRALPLVVRMLVPETQRQILPVGAVIRPVGTVRPNNPSADGSFRILTLSQDRCRRSNFFHA